ncbi:MAG TPA: hypothetical protein VJ890_02575, partial [Vineibacter sp.]|nr:hypothetical protein [Vineibacter sp.]
MDFYPIDVDPDHDHVGVGEAGRKPRVQLARPQGAHFRDIFDDRRATAEGDVAVAGRMLKCEGDQRRGPHFPDFARAS